jgi:hypothetical protein
MYGSNISLIAVPIVYDHALAAACPLWTFILKHWMREEAAARAVQASEIDLSALKKRSSAFILHYLTPVGISGRTAGGEAEERAAAAALVCFLLGVSSFTYSTQYHY